MGQSPLVCAQNVHNFMGISNVPVVGGELGTNPPRYNCSQLVGSNIFRRCPGILSFWLAVCVIIAAGCIAAVAVGVIIDPGYIVNIEFSPNLKQIHDTIAWVSINPWNANADVARKKIVDL